MSVEIYTLLAVILFLLFDTLWSRSSMIAYIVSSSVMVIASSLLNLNNYEWTFLIGGWVVTSLYLSLNIKNSSWGALKSFLTFCLVILALSASTLIEHLTPLFCLYFLSLFDSAGKVLKKSVVDLSSFILLSGVLVVVSSYNDRILTGGVLVLLALNISRFHSARMDKEDSLNKLIANLIMPVLFIYFIDKTHSLLHYEINEYILGAVIISILYRIVKKFLIKPDTAAKDLILWINNFLIILLALLLPQQGLDLFVYFTLISSLILMGVPSGFNFRRISNQVVLLIASLPILLFCVDIGVGVEKSLKSLSEPVIVCVILLITTPLIVYTNLVRRFSDEV